MTAPLQAEATGQEFVYPVFRGHQFRVPLDVDSWPLAAIRASYRVDEAGTLLVNYLSVASALRLLLGEQWPEFQRVAPKRKHLGAATQAFAEAVGIGSRGDNDQVFGSLPWLLLVLEKWPLQVESDLDRFWGIDYTDRWLFQAGRRRLTLRKIYARLTNLPTDSALAIAMNDGKLHLSDAALVLMDLYQHGVGRGEPHPSRPKSAAQKAADAALAAQEEAARADYRKRSEKRTRRQEGVENARANARRAMKTEGAQSDG